MKWSSSEIPCLPGVSIPAAPATKRPSRDGRKPHFQGSRLLNNVSCAPPRVGRSEKRQAIHFGRIRHGPIVQAERAATLHQPSLKSSGKVNPQESPECLPVRQRLSRAPFDSYRLQRHSLRGRGHPFQSEDLVRLRGPKSKARLTLLLSRFCSTSSPQQP